MDRTGLLHTRGLIAAAVLGATVAVVGGCSGGEADAPAETEWVEASDETAAPERTTPPPPRRPPASERLPGRYGYIGTYSGQAIELGLVFDGPSMVRSTHGAEAEPVLVTLRDLGPDRVEVQMDTAQGQVAHTFVIRPDGALFDAAAPEVVYRRIGDIAVEGSGDGSGAGP